MDLPATARRAREEGLALWLLAVVGRAAAEAAVARTAMAVGKCMVGDVVDRPAVELFVYLVGKELERLVGLRYSRVLFFEFVD